MQWQTIPVEAYQNGTARVRRLENLAPGPTLGDFLEVDLLRPSPPEHGFHTTADEVVPRRMRQDVELIGLDRREYDLADFPWLFAVLQEPTDPGLPIPRRPRPVAPPSRPGDCVPTS